MNAYNLRMGVLLLVLMGYIGEKFNRYINIQ